MEVAVDLALAFVPVPFWQNPYAGIQDAEQHIAQPDQEWRIEGARLTDLTHALEVDDACTRVPGRPEQPPQGPAHVKVRQLPHDSQFADRSIIDRRRYVECCRSRWCAPRRT